MLLHGWNVFVVDPKMLVWNEKHPSNQFLCVAAMLLWWIGIETLLKFTSLHGCNDPTRPENATKIKNDRASEGWIPVKTMATTKSMQSYKWNLISPPKVPC